MGDGGGEGVGVGAITKKRRKERQQAKKRIEGRDDGGARVLRTPGRAQNARAHPRPASSPRHSLTYSLRR